MKNKVFLIISVLVLYSIVLGVELAKAQENHFLSPRIQVDKIFLPISVFYDQATAINNQDSATNQIMPGQRKNWPIPKFAKTYLPGYFGFSINYDVDGQTGVHLFYFPNSNLFQTEDDGIVIAVSENPLCLPFLLVIKLDVSTGEILDFTVSRSFPEELNTMPRFKGQIIKKIKKKNLTDIISHDNGTIKFGYSTLGGGSYFYTKYDDTAWIHFEERENKYYVHFWDNSHKLFMYYVLTPLKKSIYTIDKEFHFKFNRGYMSTKPLDEQTLYKLKLIPRTKKLEIKKPILIKLKYLGELPYNNVLVHKIETSI